MNTIHNKRCEQKNITCEYHTYDELLNNKVGDNRTALRAYFDLIIAKMPIYLKLL